MNTAKTTPKDFFLHLGATIALYAAVIALINLSFSVIDYVQPDALAGYFSSNTIAWPISMLIVLVPLLYILELFLVRDIRLIPEKATLWIRRWRIYLTLFLAGGTIIGDLIALINTYLSGEITARFAYKVLAILVICGIVFAYYLLARVTEEAKGRTARRSVAVAGLVVILIAIVSGFAIVGSPGKQRDIRFDNQRENDLQNIQWQVLSHWQRVGELPADLEKLKDPLSGSVIPTDPATKMPYEYAVKGRMSFELCAAFALSSQNNQGKGAYGRGGGMYYATDMSYPVGIEGNWTHAAGRACFSRTIDPARYPVTPKTY